MVAGGSVIDARSILNDFSGSESDCERAWDNVGKYISGTKSKSSEMGGFASKDDKTKLRLELITPEITEALGAVFTYGANSKYAPRNWEKGLYHQDLYGCVQRHLLAYQKGEALDAESGLPHLWHALCRLGMLVTMVQRRSDLDGFQAEEPK